MSIKNFHITVLEKLIAEINEGKLTDGTFLPTESEMAANYQVSRPTIAKVYDALKEKGLVQKIKGKGTFITGTVTAKQVVIGLLVPSPTESEIFEVINDDIVRLSAEKKFTCLWDNHIASVLDGREKQVFAAIQTFIKKNVNGVIFAPLERIENADAINAKIISTLTRANIPVVLADRDYLPFPSRSPFDLACLDNFEATFTLTQQLIENQCDNLYFIYRPYSAYSVNMRIAAFREALISSEIQFSAKNIICGHPEDETIISKFDIKPEKTGIVCANDSTAAGLLLNLKKQQITVPEMVKVAAFDDMKYAAHLYAPLTTIQQPAREIARSLINLILDRIANPELPPRQVLHSGTLIIRESSGKIG